MSNLKFAVLLMLLEAIIRNQTPEHSIFWRWAIIATAVLGVLGFAYDEGKKAQQRQKGNEDV